MSVIVNKNMNIDILIYIYKCADSGRAFHPNS